MLLESFFNAKGFAISWCLLVGRNVTSYFLASNTTSIWMADAVLDRKQISFFVEPFRLCMYVGVVVSAEMAYLCATRLF